MTFSEAQLFIQGMQRRHRPIYESARMIHGCIGGLFAKDYKLPEFPWDESNRDTSLPSEDEINDMLENARRFEQQLNLRQ